MSSDRTRTQKRSGRSATDRDDVAEFDAGIDEDGGRTDADSGGLRERAGSRVRKLFSPRHFFLAAVLAAVGLFVASAFIPLPGAGLLGLLAATFGFGLVVEKRRYAEAAAAGGLVGGVSFLLEFVALSLLGGLGVGPALLGAGLGGGLAILGTYFGRDLRHGLTQEVP